MTMFSVGLTGGVASGKSALANRLAALGAFIADADVLARELVEPGQPALAHIMRVFGSGVLGADGHLDRGGLRARVFGDASARKQLEGILHPAIRAELQRQCEAADAPYAVAVVPLLAEGGGRLAYPWLDRIVVVDVPESVQRERLLQRDHVDGALADRMLAAQAARAQRLAIADDVVENTAGLDALDAAAARLDRFYRGLAALV